MLHPQEHYNFALKRFGKLPSIRDQSVGGITNKDHDQSGYTFDHGSGSSIGGVTKSKDQEDQNAAGTQAIDQTKQCMTQGVEEREEEDPSIDGYYSDGHEDQVKILKKMMTLSSSCEDQADGLADHFEGTVGGINAAAESTKRISSTKN